MSRTTRDALRAGRYVRCSGRRLPDLGLPDGRRPTAFALAVEEVRQDVVPYAELTHGVEFRLAEPRAALDRWRAVVEALRGQDQTAV